MFQGKSLFLENKAQMIDHQHLIFIFGVLGNIVSILVYLSPAPTFYRIHKKKSTENFQSLPYQVTLFSCMIWLYYALLKPDSLLLITVNSFGFIAETAYIAIYITYAPKDEKISTTKLFGGMNVVAFSCIILFTRFLVDDVKFRVLILGWICVAVSTSVFAAPLNILARVVRTKSVEFMPFTLSFFLTLSAVLWSAYGVLQKDKYVAIPNITGFFLGMGQMVVYAIYRNCAPNQINDLKTIVVMGPKNMSEDLSTNDVRLVNVHDLENLGKMEAQIHDLPTKLNEEELPAIDNNPETVAKL